MPFDIPTKEKIKQDLAAGKDIRSCVVCGSSYSHVMMWNYPEHCSMPCHAYTAKQIRIQRRLQAYGFNVK